MHEDQEWSIRFGQRWSGEEGKIANAYEVASWWLIAV